MSVLLIDCGNTHFKYSWCGTAVFQSIVCYDLLLFREDLDNALKSLEKPDEIVVANVAASFVAEELTNWSQEHWLITPNFLTATSKACGLTNAYSQPETLGIDRWCAMIAAWHHIKGAVCVIDAGTAITLDVIDANGAHQGGIIYPGSSTLQKSLLGTTQLLLDDDVDHASFLGDSTASCVHLGVQKGSLYFLDSVCRDVSQQFPEVSFVITGGDAKRFKSQIRTKIDQHPLLVFEGMALLSEK